MQTFRKKKYLGQHFLTDKNIAGNIVNLLDIKTGDVVVEIGPGLGALTQLLAESPGQITAVEVDRHAVTSLEEIRTRRLWNNVTILLQDFLEFDLTEFSRKKNSMLRLIGNLPYNISSQIFFHVLDHHSCVNDCTFMVQKEVAERIVAPHGSKVYGKLSIFAQVHADTKLAFSISPNVFQPMPKVWSAVITMKMNDRRLHEIADYRFFRTLVRQVFTMRRKKLSNSLKAMGLDIRTAPDPIRDFYGKRPEDLNVDEFILLANAFVRSPSNTVHDS